MASSDVLQIIRKNIGPFPAALLHAILEWVVIVLLFLDGLLFFLATEFARFFGLEIPCFLCTRIDHVLVHRDPDTCYKESICRAHAKELTPLAFCHAHQRLSNARRMCRGCLASLTTVAAADRKSSSEMYRCIIGREDERGGGTCQCSCCGGSLRTQVLPYGTKVRPEIPIPPMPAKGGRSLMRSNDWRGGFDESSSHVGYRGLSLMSDAASEIAAATDDDSSLMLASESEFDNGSRRCGEVLDDNSVSEASVGVTEEPFCLLDGGSSAMGSPGSADKESHDSNLGHGLEELTWDKDLSSQPSNSTSGAAVGTGPNNHGRLEKVKSIGLDEAYALATMSKVKQPFRFNESKTVSTPTPPGLPVLRKRLSMGKDRGGVESLKGGGSMGKVHWKSLLHRLKRQVCLDRKSLIALSSELDEERSASAVAANQAMAMITRLQEEKAAVRMEALQYQRMMEEQAEYDQETLQVMSDLLIKREKKIKLLEAKVETYSAKFQLECEKSGYKEMADEDYPKLRPCASTPSVGGISDICASVSLGVIDENDGEQQQFS